MISHYIKGYNKRYSITSCGNVIRHYRYMNNGNKRYEDIKLTKALNQDTSKSVSISLLTKTTRRREVLNTLMIEYFNLTPPDDQHQYKAISKDGNIENNSVKNIGWVINTRKEYKFKPRCFHRKGKIVSKICGDCGEVKKIKHFRFSGNPNWKGAKGVRATRRNKCEQCRSLRQWDYIKSDPEIYKRVLKNGLAWAKSKKGRAYHLQYERKTRNNLGGWYINRIIKRLGMKPEYFTPEMKDIIKTNILIHREIKNQT